LGQCGGEGFSDLRLDELGRGKCFKKGVVED